MSIEKPDFEDKTIVCVECGQEFIWEKGEQIYFYSKGLSAPKRCKDCRELRKSRIFRWEEGANG